jgi:hypothetical protein
MLSHTMFSLSTVSPLQAIAFVVFACFTIGFFVWVVKLVREK